jgi:hypothetical protein
MSDGFSCTFLGKILFALAIISYLANKSSGLRTIKQNYLLICGQQYGARHGLQPQPGEGWKSQGRFLSSVFLGDWQLLLSSSFSCWWGCMCKEPSQFRSGPSDRGTD